MKYYFIMNPVAGSKRTRERFIREIGELTTPYELIYTTHVGDAKIYARDICESAEKRGEDVRIFACGGDGTLSDVVNGAIGCARAEVGCIPMGTGNDFIRNFGSDQQFYDINAYIDSYSVVCDSIQYTAVNGGERREGHCINMVNIGMDCNIVDTTDSIKKIPVIQGSVAYLTSVFINLIQKKGEKLKISYDDGYTYDDKLLLISIANGCYCGGGIKGLPLAKTDDGLMDVSLVKNVSRRQFVMLFPKYSKGTHLDSPAIKKKDILKYTNEKHLHIESEVSFKVCIDGEISKFREVDFEIAPESFRFIVPGVQ